MYGYPEDSINPSGKYTFVDDNSLLETSDLIRYTHYWNGSDTMDHDIYNRMNWVLIEDAFKFWIGKKFSHMKAKLGNNFEVIRKESLISLQTTTRIQDTSQTYSCGKCGMVGLHWKQRTSGKWWFVYDDDSWHNCNDHLPEEPKSDSKPPHNHIVQEQYSDDYDDDDIPF